MQRRQCRLNSREPSTAFRRTSKDAKASFTSSAPGTPCENCLQETLQSVHVIALLSVFYFLCKTCALGNFRVSGREARHVGNLRSHATGRTLLGRMGHLIKGPRHASLSIQLQARFFAAMGSGRDPILLSETRLIHACRAECSHLAFECLPVWSLLAYAASAAPSAWLSAHRLIPWSPRGSNHVSSVSTGASFS